MIQGCCFILGYSRPHEKQKRKPSHAQLQRRKPHRPPVELEKWSPTTNPGEQKQKQCANGTANEMMNLISSCQWIVNGLANWGNVVCEYKGTKV